MCFQIHNLSFESPRDLPKVYLFFHKYYNSLLHPLASSGKRSFTFLFHHHSYKKNHHINIKNIKKIYSYGALHSCIPISIQILNQYGTYLNRQSKKFFVVGGFF